MIDDEVSEYEIKLNDTSMSAAELSRLIRDCCFFERFSLSDLLCISRCLLKGETWRPTVSMLKVDPRKTKLVEVATIVYERARSEMEIRYEQQQAYWKLMEAGAAGDAEAAIKACKLIVTHKFLPNACMG